MKHYFRISFDNVLSETFGVTCDSVNKAFYVALSQAEMVEHLKPTTIKKVEYLFTSQ